MGREPLLPGGEFLAGEIGQYQRRLVSRNPALLDALGEIRAERGVLKPRPEYLGVENRQKPFDLGRVAMRFRDISKLAIRRHQAGKFSALDLR
jgi:hypothetical protein